MSDNLNERVGTEVLDFEDRRRLAASEILMVAERNGGGVYPMQFGEVVLQWVTTEDETIPMGDRVIHCLNKMMGA